MGSSRRTFIKKTSLGIASVGIAPLMVRAHAFSINNIKDTGINPWIELSKKAYLENAETISRMAGNTPILAVLKNNAYGLGDVETASILDHSPYVEGYALVKDARCLALRKGGIKKPILLMGDFANNMGTDLAKADITLSAFSKESSKKIIAIAKNNDLNVKVHLYFDTGLGRMGMPYDAPLDWAVELASTKNISVTGLFSTLTTPLDFAKEQIERFNKLESRLHKLGVPITKKHIAPSLSILELKASHMNLVRPGILLHGSFPLTDMAESNAFKLQPTFRLKAKVIRLEKLKKGDTIGFSRFYELQQDEWIATIPIGWADGYASAAENGAKVLIENKLYTVVNVNASHCNVLVGSEKTINVGDTATLIGPDMPEITPEGFAKLIKGHNYLQINYKESIPKFVHDAFV